jgi:pseudouridine-5'-phosphate glycosidase
MQPKLNIHPEIRTALENRQAIVALESTLITHGFSPPENLKIAKTIEQVVRDEGAVPATIAILAGEITVGLTVEQLEYLASARNVRKCSRCDLAIAVARREDGATTVAGTMMVARWANIPIFATGGIGGVHRGQPFDESADLTELTRSPIAVVCAGAKAILDLPLTREVLETRGVPVIGYRTDELPAFYSRTSGLPVDIRVETPAEVADIIHAHQLMKIESGILVTVPVPIEDEWPAEEARQVIHQALFDAETQNIVGKAVTPYLLSRVSQLSEGRSKQANIALLLNNAKIAAQIGLALISKKNGSM